MKPLDLHNQDEASVSRPVSSRDSLDEILLQVIKDYNQHDMMGMSDTKCVNRAVGTARRAIHQWALDIIGADERKAQRAYLTHSNDFTAVVKEKARNALRKEQRAKLGGQN